MYVLSEEQIEYIRNDLIAKGVETEDLQLNLLDHICCIIESELPTGGDFASFYAIVIKRFYKNDLREIQEETTLLLTFKHYYAMKKTMTIAGIFIAICMTCATVFKFNHWPGAAIFFVLGFVFFALLFLPLMFILKMKEKPETKNKVVLAIGMLLGIISVCGVMFKIMHWPGASILIYSALLVLCVLFIPIYFFSGIRNPVAKFNTIVTTVLLIGGAGMLMSLVSIRPSWAYSVMHIQGDEWLHSETKSLNKMAKNMEVHVLKDTAAGELKKLIISAAGICGTIDSLVEIIAVQASEGNEKQIDWSQVSVSNDFDAVNTVLFKEDTNGKNAPIRQLRKDIEDFEKLATAKGYAVKIVEASNNGNSEAEKEWEITQFRNNTVSIAVRKLLLLQSRVRTAELEILLSEGKNVKSPLALAGNSTE